MSNYLISLQLQRILLQSHNVSNIIDIINLNFLIFSVSRYLVCQRARMVELLVILK
jgi:hypothetical protein